MRGPILVWKNRKIRKSWTNKNRTKVAWKTARKKGNLIWKNENVNKKVLSRRICALTSTQNQNVIRDHSDCVGSHSNSSIPKAFLPAQFSLHIISVGAALNITAERIVPNFSDTRTMFIIYRKTTLKRYLNRKLRWRKRLRIDCSNSYCQDRNS